MGNYKVEPLKLQKAFNQLHGIVLDLLHLNKQLIKEKEELKGIVIDLLTNNVTDKTINRLEKLQLFETKPKQADQLIEKALMTDKNFIKHFEDPIREILGIE